MRYCYSPLCRSLEVVVLFLIGSVGYYGIEVLWRGHSHWSMALVGGICFLLIGGLNERYFQWNMCLFFQSLVGAVCVTLVELLAGLILNVWLDLGIWDYSNLPLQLWGQISLLFTIFWIPLSMLGIVLDDWIRYYFFGEERPFYHLFRQRSK